jgi:hypothetical protein
MTPKPSLSQCATWLKSVIVEWFCRPKPVNATQLLIWAGNANHNSKPYLEFNSPVSFNSKIDARDWCTVTFNPAGVGQSGAT